MSSLGKLKIKVVCGRELQNKEFFQSSDPYCKVEVGDQSHKTKHLSNSLNPDWNEEFEFDVQQGTDIISLSVWDKNSFKKDVFMGYSFVTFDDCKKDEAKEKKALMKGSCSGEVHLIVTPNFETSASKIERLDNEMKQVLNKGEEKDRIDENILGVKENNEELQKENEQLRNQISELNNTTLEREQEKKEIISNLESSRKYLTDQDKLMASLEEQNAALNKQIENLKNKMADLISKQEVNEAENQIPVCAEVNYEERSTSSCTVYNKLKTENTKLTDFKNSLDECLLGFQSIQSLIFNQLTQQDASKDNITYVNMLKERLLGFEKIQELMFNQLRCKLHSFDLAGLKEIEKSLLLMLQ